MSSFSVFLRVLNVSATDSAAPTIRSRASSVAPMYVSAARSASDLPCSAVMRAARAWAEAASRVSFVACVRTRRPVLRDGVVAVVRRAAGLRFAAAGLRFAAAAGFLAAAGF